MQPARQRARFLLVHIGYRDRETWFWGVSFQLTNRKSYGHVTSLDAAKAMFRAEYLTWKGTVQ